MRVFVPMPDDWDSGIAFPGEAPVPFRAGLPVWREPKLAEPAQDSDAPRAA